MAARSWSPRRPATSSRSDLPAAARDGRPRRAPARSLDRGPAPVPGHRAGSGPRLPAAPGPRGGRPNNLRLRADELRRARPRDRAGASAILDDSPLLTLVGPGGVGKTRLGLRLARIILDRVRRGSLARRAAATVDRRRPRPPDDRQRRSACPSSRSRPVRRVVDHLRSEHPAARPRQLRARPRCHGGRPSADPRRLLGVRILVTSREASRGRRRGAHPCPSTVAARRQRQVTAAEPRAVEAGRAVRRPGAGRPAGLRGHRPQRAGGRPALPPPRRDPARDRARRGPRPGPCRSIRSQPGSTTSSGC